MKSILHSLTPLGVALAIALLFTSCQATRSTNESSKKRSMSPPTEAEPLPAWTKNKAPGAIPRPDRMIKITAKVLEITRDRKPEDANIKVFRKRLTAREAEELLRDSRMKKGTDLLTAPSVIGRNGENVTVEVIREFIYPVSPGEKPELKTVNVGVSAHHRARTLADGKTIRLDTFTEVCEFEGFHEVSPNFDLPVFSRRRAEASLRLLSGESVVIGGIIKEEDQEVEDSDFFGLIKKRSVHPLTRELMVIVTPTIFDATGKPAKDED